MGLRLTWTDYQFKVKKKSGVMRKKNLFSYANRHATNTPSKPPPTQTHSEEGCGCADTDTDTCPHNLKLWTDVIPYTFISGAISM